MSKYKFTRVTKTPTSLKDEWDAMEKEQDALDRARRIDQQRLVAKEEELIARLAKEINVPREDIDIGHWECPTSPIGRCVYNYQTDPANDDCLFCHQPDERK